MALEAGEVLEHFQWKSQLEIEDYIKTHKSEIGEELADVFWFVLLLSNDLKINLITAFNQKLKKNNKKYPIIKAKGKHTKYNLL